MAQSLYKVVTILKKMMIFISYQIKSAQTVTANIYTLIQGAHLHKLSKKLQPISVTKLRIKETN